MTATRGSWRYRAGRFVRRHRAGVAATAAVVIALCAGIGATAREARIARRQADIARTQKARAEKRFNDVRKLSDSLIFDVHDAIQGLPGATPARRLLLDRAVEYLDSASKDAAGDPDLQRELGWGYQRLAVVQGSPSESNLGDLDAALASDRKALALFESVAKANPADTIDQLNVAMMHRILAYSSLTDPNGRRDLDAAMTITGRLLAGGTNDPRVRSERSIEYQNLALLHDANGDRVHALDAYRKNRELKLDILRTNPDYRLIRRGLGMATVLVGTALARVGERDEALHMMDEGIGFYASLNKDGDDVNASRERAVASQKRGDILLMNGDTSGALAIYRQARRVLEPMAAADPQNTMLQLDVAGMIYHEARALARSRQYDGAIAGLQRAAAIYGKVHAPGRSADDSPRGAGSIFISLGDAYAGRGDRRAALESYGNATAALQADWRRSPDDDMRCELAVSFVKSADMLAGAGDFREASARYQQALDLLGDVVADHRDVPAWYVIADAHAGMGRLAEARARVTADLAMRSTLRAEAEAHYARSLSTWKQIPNPSRVSPSGFGAGDPKFVEAALAKLRGVSE